MKRGRASSDILKGPVVASLQRGYIEADQRSNPPPTGRPMSAEVASGTGVLFSG